MNRGGVIGSPAGQRPHAALVAIRAVVIEDSPEQKSQLVRILQAEGDRVVMLGRCSWRFKRTGKVVSTPKADSWRFADGKAVEFYEYFDTAGMRDAMA